MKITKAYNKNFSQKEQEDKIKNNFIDFNYKKLIFFDKEITVKEKNNFFFNIISEEDFVFLKNNFIKDPNSLVFSLELHRFLIQKEVINYNFSEIINLSSNEAENFLEDKSIDISIFSKSFKSIKGILDTSLFSVFYINKKTTNKFSFIVINKEKNIILYKRGYKKFIFGLNLKK